MDLMWLDLHGVAGRYGVLRRVAVALSLSFGRRRRSLLVQRSTEINSLLYLFVMYCEFGWFCPTDPRPSPWILVTTVICNLPFSV